MGTKKTREAKIEFLKSTIDAFFKKKKDGSISRDKLLAEFCMYQLSTYRTGNELLQMLEKMGDIKINGDLITR